MRLQERTSTCNCSSACKPCVSFSRLALKLRYVSCVQASRLSIRLSALLLTLSDVRAANLLQPLLKQN